MYNYDADNIENAIIQAKDLLEELRENSLIEQAYGGEIDTAVNDLDGAVGDLNDLDDKINVLENEECEEGIDASELEDKIADLRGIVNDLEWMV